ncbi:MAG: hypothetical protein JXL20_05260, partial [Deltaproteobacteria bacterium]|nr:hypothetical protein [Deltaproteobacteria bacterium]
YRVPLFLLCDCNRFGHSFSPVGSIKPHYLVMDYKTDVRSPITAAVTMTRGGGIPTTGSDAFMDDSFVMPQSA